MITNCKSLNSLDDIQLFISNNKSKHNIVIQKEEFQAYDSEKKKVKVNFIQLDYDNL